MHKSHTDTHALEGVTIPAPQQARAGSLTKVKAWAQPVGKAGRCPPRVAAETERGDGVSGHGSAAAAALRTKDERTWWQG